MTKTKTTKRALIASVLSLLVCFTMLIGSTFAWFTDSATTGVNRITAGNLDVILEYNTDCGSTWTNAEAATDIFTTDKWEPGFTQVVYFKVTNNGSLAFDYKVATNIVKETAGVNQEGDNFNLSDHLQFGIVETETAFTSRDLARAAIETPSKFSAVQNGEKVLTSGDDQIFAMVVWMPEETTNVANHDGINVPEIQFGINVIASQATVESDSFNNQYDVNAAYPKSPQLDAIVATPGTPAELNSLIEDAAGASTAQEITINLDQDFDLTGYNWESITPSGYNGVKNVVLNGNGHKIIGLNNTLFVGSFGGNGSITINDLTIENAAIQSNNYNGMGLGAFVSYSDSSGSIALNNCHLITSSVKCIDGYAGGLVGYTSSAMTITNCSVKNSTISGQKSAGAIIGHGGANVTVNGCTVSGCTISETLEGRDSAGAAAIAGRMSGGCTLTLKGTITVESNTINQGAAAPKGENDYCANATPVIE